MYCQHVAFFSERQIRHRPLTIGEQQTRSGHGTDRPLIASGRSAIARAMIRRGSRGAVVPDAAAATATDSPAPEGRAERRRYPRRGGQCIVSLLPSPASGPLLANREWAFRASPLRGTMLDVSIGGVAFVLPKPIESGAILDLELRHAQRMVSVVRRIEVIERLLHGNDQWKILCRFTQPLSFDEVSRLSVAPTV